MAYPNNVKRYFEEQAKRMYLQANGFGWRHDDTEMAIYHDGRLIATNTATFPSMGSYLAFCSQHLLNLHEEPQSLADYLKEVLHNRD